MSDSIIDVEKAQEILDGGMKQAQDVLENNQAMSELIDKVQAKVAEYPILTDTFNDTKNLFSLLKSYVTQEYTEISPKVILTVVSAFIYLVKQKDLINDKIPVLGILDDAAIAAVALNFIKPELETYNNWKEANK